MIGHQHACPAPRMQCPPKTSEWHLLLQDCGRGHQAQTTDEFRLEDFELPIEKTSTVLEFPRLWSTIVGRATLEGWQLQRGQAPLTLV